MDALRLWEQTCFVCVGSRDEARQEWSKIQLLSSSSVAVSTSQDFDDNATITAFWGKKVEKKM